VTFRRCSSRAAISFRWSSAPWPRRGCRPTGWNWRSPRRFSSGTTRRCSPFCIDCASLGANRRWTISAWVYSSLSYLQRFPFDKIKIDRTFISDIAGSDGSRAIVQAVVSIATQRNITTTAEGVETEQQMQWLRTLAAPKCRASCSVRRAPRGTEAAAASENLSGGRTQPSFCPNHWHALRNGQST